MHPPCPDEGRGQRGRPATKRRLARERVAKALYLRWLARPNARGNPPTWDAMLADPLGVTGGSTHRMAVEYWRSTAAIAIGAYLEGPP